VTVVIAVKTLTCLRCREPFDVPHRRGVYPLHCNRPECVEGRARERARAVAAAKRRRALDREVAKRARDQIVRLLRPLIDGERSRLCAEELAELGPLVEHASFEGLGRPELRAAVVRLARAEGAAQTRRRLLELGAVCVVAARRARPAPDPR
jgi:hypothetical protein